MTHLNLSVQAIDTQLESASIGNLLLLLLFCPLRSKSENPFMHKHNTNRCITYAACIYVTFHTFSALNVFVAVLRRG